MTTIALLLASNIFMTAAWYGHLRFKSAPLWLAILVSWLIALAEYCLQVPANRWGYGQFTASQLKIAQEVITARLHRVCLALARRGAALERGGRLRARAGRRRRSLR